MDAFLLKKEKGEIAFRDIFCLWLGAREPVLVILAPKTSRISRLPLAVGKRVGVSYTLFRHFWHTIMYTTCTLL